MKKQHHTAGETPPTLFSERTMRGKYEGKTFADLEVKERIEYNGREYDTWEVEIEPGRLVKFADMALLISVEARGGSMARVDETVRCHAWPTEKVEEVIKEWQD